MRQENPNGQDTKQTEQNMNKTQRSSTEQKTPGSKIGKPNQERNR